MGKAKIRSFFEKNKGDLFINSPHKFFKQLNAQGDSPFLVLHSLQA